MIYRRFIGDIQKIYRDIRRYSDIQEIHRKHTGDI